VSIKTEEGYCFLWKTEEEIGADNGHLYSASYQIEAYNKTEKKNTTLSHKDGFEKQSGRTGGVVTGIGAAPRGSERLMIVSRMRRADTMQSSAGCSGNVQMFLGDECQNGDILDGSK